MLDGVSSESVNAIIQNRPVIEAPLRKVEWISPYGVDGDIPYDEEAYMNTELSLYMLTDGNDLIPDRQKLFNLLDTRGTYKEFVPYFDSNKIYRVMLKEKIQFENQYYFGEKQSLSVNFTVKPYKYLINSETITVNGTSTTVNNPSLYTSQPTITITGTGPSTLVINGVNYPILDIPGSITLNSERYLAYKEYESGVIESANTKVGFRNFPILKSGLNNIRASGSVTKIKIEPRWRALI